MRNGGTKTMKARNLIVVGIIISFLCIVTASSKAAEGDMEWEKAIGGSDNDTGNSVQQTSDGGYIITGGTSSYGHGDYRLLSIGYFNRPSSYDVYLIKTDSDGNTLWEKTFGGYYYDTGNSVQQTSDGGYIIAGNKGSYYEDGWEDVYLIRTDSEGNTLWEKTYGGSYLDYGSSVQQTSDGGYIIAGDTDPNGSGEYDVYLIKTDSDGNSVWEKTFGGVDYDGGYSVQQTTDGGYIIAGTTESRGAGGYDVYLIRTDSDGNAMWEKTFGGSNNDFGSSVQQTSYGGYIIAGGTNSYGAGEYDVYLIKTDSDGNTLWEKTFGGLNYDTGYSVQQTTDGGYIIAGDTDSYEAGGTDAYLIKADSNGNKLWEKTFGGSDNDYGCSVQQTSDGRYIIAGSTDSYGAGGRDVYLIKTQD
jgi:hypothetical protein